MASLYYYYYYLFIYLFIFIFIFIFIFLLSVCVCACVESEKLLMAEGARLHFDDRFSATCGIVPPASGVACSSFYRRGRAMPTLALMPTVGSSVVFDQQRCNDDTFFWEDSGVDVAYLQTAAQHALVGRVLRETDTQFVVSLDIPRECLPRELRDRVARQSFNGAKRLQGDNKATVWDKERKSDTSKSENEAMLEGPKRCRVNVRAMPPTREHNIEDDDDSHVSSQSVPVGIVPVLVLTQRRVLPPVSRSKVELLPALVDTCSGQQSCSNSMFNLSSHRQNFFSEHTVELENTSRASSVFACDNYSSNVMRVSLSVARRCCISLLQYTLEQHEKLDAVVTAIACCDFNLAVVLIEAIILSQQPLAIIQGGCRSEDTEDCAESPPSLSQPNHGTQEVNENQPTNNFFNGNKLGNLFEKIVSSKNHLIKGVKAQCTLCAKSKNTRKGIGGNFDLRVCLGEGIMQPTYETTKEKNVSFSMPQTYSTGDNINAHQSLALLYSLLSFVHFHNKEYKKSLEDAIMALSHDKTSVEAYVRAMASFMALDLTQNALDTAAVAIRCCVALSPQFVRLSRVVCVCSFYRRNLGEHSVVDVVPGVRDLSMTQKTNRPIARPTTVRVRRVSLPGSSPAAALCVAQVLVRSLLPGSSPQMDYFSRSLRARAARRFDTNDVVFSEKVSLQVLLWTPSELQTEAAAAADFFEGCMSPIDTWMLCRSRFCAYCGHSLVSKRVLLTEVCEKMSKVMAGRLRWELNEKKQLPCLAGCGDYYCGEICRNRAALEYHSMECDLSFADERESKLEGPQLAFNRFSRQEVVKSRVSCPTCVAAPLTNAQLSKRLSVRQPVNNCHLQSNNGNRECDLRMRSLPAKLLSLKSRGKFVDHLASRRMTAWRDDRRLSLLQTCRPAIEKIRIVFGSHHTAVKSAIAEKAPNAMIVALLLAGRLVSSALSLFFPTTFLASDVFLQESDEISSSEYGCRQRSTAIKTIVRRYVSRGFTSTGTSPSDRHDAHGLVLAEEVFHQLRVPFFADTNLAQPTTVWELLGEAPPSSENLADGKSLFSAANVIPGGGPFANEKEKHKEDEATDLKNIRCGFEDVAKLLGGIDSIVQSFLRDEAVAFSVGLVTDGDKVADFAVNGCYGKVGKNEFDNLNIESYGHNNDCYVRVPLLSCAESFFVWLVEEQCELPLHAQRRPSVWTFGRLLGFLGRRRFMEQLWDFCLSSYCIVPRCVFSAALHDAVPEHQREVWREICQRHTVLIAVMGPLLSVVTDLSTFGGDVCSRFFGELISQDGMNPLSLQKNDSPTMSVLSINSLPIELDETRSLTSSHKSCGNDEKEPLILDRHSVAAIMISNVKVCGNDAFGCSVRRCVTMRARRPITVGEELRYEDRPY